MAVICGGGGLVLLKEIVAGRDGGIACGRRSESCINPNTASTMDYSPF